MAKKQSKEDREGMRDMQKLFLDDKAVQEIYSASIIHGDQNYGNHSKRLAQYSYVDALKSDSPQVDKVISKAVKGRLQSNADEVLKQGGDIYQNPTLLDYGLIGKEAMEIYEIAMANVYVQDILDNLGIKINSDSGVIPKDTKNKTMEELKKSNQEVYGLLYNSYTQHIVQTTLANTMLSQDKNNIKGLESMLNVTEEEVKEQMEFAKKINSVRGKKASQED